jgi:hypothetical protein
MTTVFGRPSTTSTVIGCCILASQYLRSNSQADANVLKKLVKRLKAFSYAKTPKYGIDLKCVAFWREAASGRKGGSAARVLGVWKARAERTSGLVRTIHPSNPS